MLLMTANEILKQETIEVKETDLKSYSSRLEFSNLFTNINYTKIPIKHNSLFNICKYAKLIPEEFVLFALVFEVRQIGAKIKGITSDETKLDISFISTNSQHELLDKKECQIPNYSIKKLDTSSNKNMEKLRLKNEYINRHKIISFMFRCFYAIFFLYAFLLLIEIIVFYSKYKVFNTFFFYS